MSVPAALRMRKGSLPYLSEARQRIGFTIRDIVEVVAMTTPTTLLGMACLSCRRGKAGMMNDQLKVSKRELSRITFILKSFQFTSSVES